MSQHLSPFLSNFHMSFPHALGYFKVPEVNFSLFTVVYVFDGGKNIDNLTSAEGGSDKQRRVSTVYLCYWLKTQESLTSTETDSSTMLHSFLLTNENDEKRDRPAKDAKLYWKKEIPLGVLTCLKITTFFLTLGFHKASCYDNHLSNTELSLDIDVNYLM